MPARPTSVILELALAAIFAAAGAASARSQAPSAAARAAVAGNRAAGAASQPWLPVFEFRNVFWVNLHHFLYLQARLARGLGANGGGESAPAVWARANLSGLSAGERGAWELAVGYYASHFADHELPYDSFLVRIENRLSEMGDCPDIAGEARPGCAAGIDPSLTAILDEAAPVYRTHWWSEQERANRAWIEQAVKLVREEGGKPAEALSTAFDDPWPADPILIDVTLYAGPYGAYTTLHPVHIVLSSADPENGGAQALEAIFRESAHAIAEPVELAIIRQCQQRTQAIPRDLWEAVVFYTTARIFGSAFPSQAAGGSGAAMPLSASERAYEAARGWEGYEPLLDLYWRPYLEGRADLETAIGELVGAL